MMRPSLEWKLSKMAVRLFVLFLILSCFAQLSDTLESKGGLTKTRTSRQTRYSGYDPFLSSKRTSFDSATYDRDSYQQEKEDVMAKLHMQLRTKKLGSILRELSNKEIGVWDMQGFYDSMSYVTKQLDEKKAVEKLVKRLEDKFQKYLQVLEFNKRRVESLYQFHLKKAMVLRRDCCSMNKSVDSTFGMHHNNISQLVTCDLLPPQVPQNSFNPGRNLTEVFRRNLQAHEDIKWQYFMSKDGIHNEFPGQAFPEASYTCQEAYDFRHRDVFVSSILPQRKHVVIVVDQGNSLSDDQLNTAKGVAKHVISSLSETDLVSIFGLADKTQYPRGGSDPCLKMTAPLTAEVKFFFNDFLDKLQKQETSTAHAVGLKTALETLESSLKTHNESEKDEAMVVYISRGLLSSLTEARDVLDTIAVQNSQTGHRVVINAYAVIGDGKPIMFEKKFLQQVADQNFDKYDVERRHPAPVRPGQMLAINSTKDLSSTVGLFYQSFNQTKSEEPVFKLPYLDSAGRGLVMSVSQACYHGDDLLGVTGLDLHFGAVVEDITYFKQEKFAYAFLINTKGFTLMHPSLTRPIFTGLQPMHTDISHFENYDGFEKIREMILNSSEGNTRFLVKTKNESHTNPFLEPREVDYAYYWKKMSNAPYIVVIKTIPDAAYMELQSQQGASKSIFYHRLDLIPTDKLCMHFKQLGSLDSSSIFLSAGAFTNPYEYISTAETKRMVQSYMAYLNDDTQLIANPGLKPEVKNDVAAISKINAVWMRMFESSKYSKHIIRRYIASPNGVFLVFPGGMIDKVLDPTKRLWYERAVEYPGQIVVTAPYLDENGAGYIVTISHTIYEGKPAAMHGDTDRVVSVMGMDIPMSYMYKLLVESIPLCEEENMRCFLLDNHGYVIAHPGLMMPQTVEVEPKVREKQHITRMEPLVANDILGHRGFVQKNLCNSFSDRTIQRYYHFNTSMVGVLTNLVHGEHCSEYQIAAVGGTNIFLGIVNQTCAHKLTAFCPCSTVDRLCLNCQRMEQHECECPCECPLQMDFCTGQLLKEEDQNPSCPRASEPVRLLQPAQPVLGEVEQCVIAHCSEILSKSECMGLVHCQWCEQEISGYENQLKALDMPFCTNQRACFGGVLGAETPYNDRIRVAEYLLTDDNSSSKSTPVGPVAGGIMGVFLVLALGVYCYRHHVHRQNHQYVTAVPDTQVRMSQLDNEPEDLDPPEEIGSGHTNVVLATFDNPANISPYRVNPNYRRPTGGDSDHGYSTMTPHEDSEQASMTCIEPLISGKDRYKPGVYTDKIHALPPPPQHRSRRSRSPTPPKTSTTELSNQTLLGGTVIPDSSHVIANVTVHMVDTH